MIEVMKKEPKRFEWLHLMTTPKDDDMSSLGHYSDETLHELLKKHTNFNLCKMKRKMMDEVGSNQCCIDYLLRPETEGMYVCLLDDKNGDTLHTITIDCNKNLVFDCLNDYVMKLEMGALDFCVGPEGGGLESINHCYEVRPKNDTRNKKSNQGDNG